MNKKIKIMLLHNIISPYRNPLFEELSKNYDLTVYFCKENDSNRAWSTKLENYTFKYKILPHKQIGPFVFNPTIKKELQKNDYDIYILFENPENSFSIRKIIKFAKNNNKKIICVNGRNNDELFSLIELKKTKNIIKKTIYNFSKSIYKYHRKKIYDSSNKFISYNKESTKYLIKNKINKNNIFTGIQNYPESLLPKPKWKNKPTKYKNKKILLYLGYLNNRKGIEYLINAFIKLNREDTLLLIAGTGEKEKDLKKLAKKNNNIIFLGYIEGIIRANYYSISDIFILPTLFDVWGHVVTEALYYGVPVICTENTGAKELIQEKKTGFIVPIKDCNILANKIQELLNNSKLLDNMKDNVKKIPKTKIVDIKTTANIFKKSIDECLNK